MSLTLHTALFVLMIHEKIKLLLEELTPPTLVDARKLPVAEQPITIPEPPAPAIIKPPAKTIPELSSPKPTTPPAREAEKQKPKKPGDQNNENIEWGEKDGKGFAITSAPGKTPMSARQGI